MNLDVMRLAQPSDLKRLLVIVVVGLGLLLAADFAWLLSEDTPFDGHPDDATSVVLNAAVFTVDSAHFGVAFPPLRKFYWIGAHPEPTSMLIGRAAGAADIGDSSKGRLVPMKFSKGFFLFAENTTMNRGGQCSLFAVGQIFCPRDHALGSPSSEKQFRLTGDAIRLTTILTMTRYIKLFHRFGEFASWTMFHNYNHSTLMVGVK